MTKYDVIERPFITEYSVIQNDKPVHFLSVDEDGNIVFKIRVGINQYSFGENHQKLHIDLSAANFRANELSAPSPMAQGMEADIPDEKRSSFIFEASYNIPERKILDQLGSYFRITIFVLTESLKDSSYIPFTLLNTALFFESDEPNDER